MQFPSRYLCFGATAQTNCLGVRWLRAPLRVWAGEASLGAPNLCGHCVLLTQQAIALRLHNSICQSNGNASPTQIKHQPYTTGAQLL